MANYWDYLEAGFKIFGLLGKTDHDGEPLGEKEAFKKPVSSNWQHTPDWSDEQIECMEESGQLDTGWGVLCYGYLIIDIDPRNGGDKSFKKLCKDLKIDLLAVSSFAVQTGGGGQHIYFKLEDEKTALQSHLNSYQGIDFKSSGFVVGCGSLHQSGLVYESIKGNPCDVSTPPIELLAALKKPEKYRAKTSLGTIDVNVEEVKEILSHISPDCDYETWIRCGMALHHSVNGDGLDIFDEWSKTGSKYPSYEQIERHWYSFGKSPDPVGLGTIIHYAEENGYQQPVTFESNFIDESAPLETIVVDLKRPPGFVGEVCEWINQQCLYPRESLATAAALMVVGNIAGLRYIDEKDGFTSNMTAFCVAGSSTGKESIQQAFLTCLRAAGVSGALHGNIKSEQEIIRNLTTHQACFYSIDEIGIILKKILNAGRSGASYLEGVIGLIMSAYSKADGFLPVSGDVKKGIIDDLQKELAICRKKVEENEDKAGRYQSRIDSIERVLSTIDSGIESPFLSLIGYTTPVTFNEVVNYEMATNGFVSRSMIFDEPETNPKRKKGFRKQPMSDSLKMRLSALYNAGNSDTGHRIENYNDKIKIGTTQRGLDLLDRVYDHFWSESEKAKEVGLEAIPRRGYELVGKISFTLAVADGVRTDEHIEWAFSLVNRDIDLKMKLAFSNMNKDDAPSDALAVKIQSTLERSGESLSEGVLASKCRPFKKEEVKTVIDKLVECKKILRVESTNSKNRTFVKYAIA